MCTSTPLSSTAAKVKACRASGRLPNRFRTLAWAMRALTAVLSARADACASLLYDVIAVWSCDWASGSPLLLWLALVPLQGLVQGCRQRLAHVLPRKSCQIMTQLCCLFRQGAGSPALLLCYPRALRTGRSDRPLQTSIQTEPHCWRSSPVQALHHCTALQRSR